MAAIYSNGGNRWNILGFNFTKRDALSSVYKISMVYTRLAAVHVTYRYNYCTHESCSMHGRLIGARNPANPPSKFSHVFHWANIIFRKKHLLIN